MATNDNQSFRESNGTFLVASEASCFVMNSKKHLNSYFEIFATSCLKARGDSPTYTNCPSRYFWNKVMDVPVNYLEGGVDGNFFQGHHPLEFE